MRTFKFLTKMDLGFLMFLSFVVVCVSGMIKTSVAGSAIMFILLTFLFIFLYAFWYLIYKLSNYIYKVYIKERIDDFKKTKEKVQKE